MKIKILKGVRHNGERLNHGDVVEMPGSDAQRLVNRKVAEQVFEGPVPVTKSVAAPAKPSAPAKAEAGESGEAKQEVKQEPKPESKAPAKAPDKKAAPKSSGTSKK